MEWMQSANAKLAKTSVSKVERTPRHFIRSEAFVNEKVINRKGPSNRALTKVKIQQH